MNAVNYASVAVAVIAALAAWASARTNAKSAQNNEKTKADAILSVERLKIESAAFERARAMDDKTIQRQDEEIEDIRAANKILRSRVVDLEEDNERLRKRVTHLERKLEDKNGQQDV